MKKLFLAGLVCCFVACMGLVFLKIFVEYRAGRKARHFLEEIQTPRGGQEFFIAAAAEMYEQCTLQAGAGTGLLEKLRGYVTNPLVPGIMRIQGGAIDVLHLRGNCDARARALQFVLEEAGYDAWQLNLVAPHGGHSVTLAQDEAGNSYMLDPYMGVAPYYQGRFIGPEEARDLALDPARADELEWYPLVADARSEWYHDFADTVFAKAGEPLEIQVDVRLDGAQGFMVGSEDGDSDDVADAAADLGWSPYWDYVGSKYDRAWDRVMAFAQDTRVEIALLDPPDERFVTTRQRPRMQGTSLVYEVRAGESLVFDDGGARRDWLHMRGYQGVDYIRFDALSAP